MTIKFQLTVILKQAGLTQEKLASELTVSFPTLNSWINERSTPRASAQTKIAELYRKYTGDTGIPLSQLGKKYTLLLQKQKLYPRLLALILKRPDLADEFMLSLTYHSNRMEGNTLTEDETADVLFKKNPLPNKTFIEQLEVKNHQTALLYLWSHLRNDPLNESWILKIHGILMNGIREDSGFYRNHAVRIVGSHVPTANYLKIPILMKEFVKRLPCKKGGNIFRQCAILHAEFEKIHPFSDGNGRVGRLLLQALLLKAGFAPALIREEKKRLYYTFLRKAQLENDTSPLEDFIMDGVLDGYGLFE